MSFERPSLLAYLQHRRLEPDSTWGIPRPAQQTSTPSVSTMAVLILTLACVLLAPFALRRYLDHKRRAKPFPLMNLYVVPAVPRIPFPTPYIPPLSAHKP